jgi:hypothetical protein
MSGAKQHLDDIVEPTINDFENNPTSVRHAFLACVATFHTVDYLAREAGKSSAHLRQIYRSESQDFALIDDVAHAFKHVSVGKHDEPKLVVSEVISRPPAILGLAVFDLSRFDDADGGVTLDKERQIDLLDSLRKTVAHLQSKVS